LKQWCPYRLLLFERLVAAHLVALHCLLRIPLMKTQSRKRESSIKWWNHFERKSEIRAFRTM
jgi:hypothetical protein